LPGYFACYVLELNTIVLLVTKLLKWYNIKNSQGSVPLSGLC
jgi:hypothetical protein